MSENNKIREEIFKLRAEIEVFMRIGDPDKVNEKLDEISRLEKKRQEGEKS